MNISAITTAITDRYGTVTTAKLERYIAAAVQEYSRYNPRILRTEITTVADQQTYSLSTLVGIIGIRDIYWPSEVAATTLRRNTLPEEDPYRYHLFSHTVVDDIQRQEWNKRIRGSGHYRPATCELYLPDAPAGGETIVLDYYAAHQKVSASYPTIPDEDESLIRDLVLAELYEADSFEMAMQPDYKEGQESETFHHITGNLGVVVDRLRSRLARKYGNGTIDIGP